MAQTFTRTYDDYETAWTVVEELEAEGISATDISLIGRFAEIEKSAEDDEGGAGEAAGIGAVLGGTAGLLAGIGIVAIPGIGPVVAAGWLASTAAGVAAGGAAGGIIGSLTSMGHSEDDANYYAETVRRGGTIVSVRAADEQVAAVEEILDRASPIDRDARLKEYRAGGWSSFDDDAPPYRPPVVWRRSRP